MDVMVERVLNMVSMLSADVDVERMSKNSKRKASHVAMRIIGVNVNDDGWFLAMNLWTRWLWVRCGGRVAEEWEVG